MVVSTHDPVVSTHAPCGDKPSRPGTKKDGPEAEASEPPSCRPALRDLVEPSLNLDPPEQVPS